MFLAPVSIKTNTMNKKAVFFTVLIFSLLILAATNIAKAQTWKELNIQIAEYNKSGDNIKAIEFAEKSKKQAEKEFGTSHKNYATSCNNLAFLYEATGNHIKAEPLYIEAKKITEKIIGKDNSQFATITNNLINLYKITKNYSKAEPLLIEIKTIKEKMYGKEHTSYAVGCYNLAVLYKNMGYYSKAEQLYIEAKNIDEKNYGKDHKYYIQSCNSLALLYLKTNNFPKAGPLLTEIKTTREKVLGKEHPDYATSCNNLAAFYKNAGNYSKAEQLLIEAKIIIEKVHGKEHHEHALSCNNLGTLYSDMGNYFKAEQLYNEAKNIYENALKKEHPNYAQCCINLAVLYEITADSAKTDKERADKYSKAEQLFIKAKAIREKVFGKEHPVYVQSCNSLAGLYENICSSAKTEKERGDNYSKAEQLYIEAKTIKENVLGTENLDYATSCSGLAVLYNVMKNYQKAEPLLIETKIIREKLLGKEHPDYIISCNNLAVLYKNMGNSVKTDEERANYYSKAELFYIETKEIRERVLGKEHPDYVETCFSLSELYYVMNNFRKAELLLIETKEIREKVLGKEHPDYVESCSGLAKLYYDTGNYRKAELLLIETKKIREKKLGKKHPDYAKSCINLAELYRITDNLSKAECLFIEAKKIIETVHGKEHHSYAANINNLAALYGRTGNYSKAEQLFIEAKEIREKVLGKDHPDYAGSYNNLAGFYYKTGNFKKAESLLIESKDIIEKNIGKTHPNYAVSCNNLGEYYNTTGDYKKAEPLLIESKDITEKILGKNHPKYARSCTNLGAIYYAVGKYKKTEPLFIEAKDILEKAYGKSHTDYAVSCNNLAELYRVTGNYQKAEPLFVEAKDIIEKKLGKKHPNYAGSCNNLALLYYGMGNSAATEKKRTYAYRKAELLYIEANGIMNFLITESAEFMSEKEREEYLTKKINLSFDFYYSFFLTKQKENVKLAGIIYNNALNIKGQLLKSATAVRKLVLQSGDTALINTYNRMNSYGEILTQQYTLPIANRRLDIKELEEKVNILEKELTRYAADFPSLQDQKSQKWQNIQKSLKNDEAAIEFIHFNYRKDKKKTDSTLYYALILRKNYKYPKAAFLFEKKQLKEIMKRSVNANEYNYIKNLYDPKSAKADSLYKLVWQPLEQFLKDTKNVYISPSGMLNKVSFDALPYDTANILSDKYKIIYTTSTAEAINKTGLYQKNINSTVLFGGIEYNIKPNEMEKLALKFNLTETYPASFENLSGIRNIDKLTRNITWNYLPGSLEETEEIQDVLKKKNINVIFYTGKQGSEEQFKALENDAPSILHVSTHGFYFGDDEKSNEYRNMIDKDIKFAHSDNPLLRSGFILAGGNTAFQGGEISEGVEDGVLTAAEISRLNFFKTKLVVLSACQTGLGDVKGSEGVYGLQRSFKMAGTDYLLFSLWSVPDETTKELMSKFYENWFSGMEIRDAFKKAQNHLKTKYAEVPGAAFAWAAFVLMK